jgi:uncharacterized membrane protein YdjX (TVP38/TMEM64 family)
MQQPAASPLHALETGVTPLRFLDYAAASWAGMLPGTFAYVYLGSLGKVAADAAAGGGSSDGSSSFDAVRIGLYGAW